VSDLNFHCNLLIIDSKRKSVLNVLAFASAWYEDISLTSRLLAKLSCETASRLDSIHVSGMAIEVSFNFYDYS
jgi:hypothetical protein